MDITPYVDSLRRDLVAAAEVGGEEMRAAAERLTIALDPAMRLALMDALSQAAAEITSELPAGSVDVRLRGREPELVVDVPNVPSPPAPPAPPTAPGGPALEEDEEDGTVARITLRIPDSLKTRAEEMATRSGQSLNTWLVATIRNATRDRALNVDIDLSSIPLVEEMQRNLGRRGGRRMTGWV